MPDGARSTVSARLLGLKAKTANLRLRVVGLLILALLPAFALMVFTAAESRSQATAKMQDNAVHLTELAAANQLQLIDGARDILITLAQIPAIQKQDRSACLFLLSNVLMQHPLYANFGAASRDGDVFCMTMPQRLPLNIADQPYFQQAMANGDFAVSQYQISPINSQAMITLAYPVLNGQNSPQGIVFANFDLRWLGAFMNAAALPAGSTLRGIDRNGIILASYPDGEFEIGQRMPELSIIGPLLDQQAELAQVRDAKVVARPYSCTSLHEGGNSEL